MIGPAGRTSVLVIVDHGFQRRSVARQLTAIGVPRVLEADRAGALELARANSQSLALILSDIDMPERDSLELLCRLAGEAPRTAVAILSALERPRLGWVETMATGYGLDLIGMIEKPATDDALRAVLVRALASGPGDRCGALDAAAG